MNEEQLQGLNLPQLLDLMHEIVAPEPVSWMPQTTGWFVLALWLGAIIGLSLVKWIAHRRRNLYRREALDLIDRIDPFANNAAAEVAAIVKRTALAVYARKDIAGLYGHAWAEFLAESAANDSQIVDAAPLIAAAAYRPGIDAAAVTGPAKRWIRVHRA